MRMSVKSQEKRSSRQRQTRRLPCIFRDYLFFQHHTTHTIPHPHSRHHCQMRQRVLALVVVEGFPRSPPTTSPPTCLSNTPRTGKTMPNNLFCLF